MQNIVFYFKEKQLIRFSETGNQELLLLIRRHEKNNGITEGFHNKMKMIVRRAYEFRNFANYRLRVRALCA